MSFKLEQIKKRDRMQKFYYQYFLTQVGSAPFKGYGTSIKKDATDAGSDGMAYRIYGCGLFAPSNINNGKLLYLLRAQ